MSGFIWKPVSESDGKLVVLTNGVGNLSLVDMDSGQTIEQGNNHGSGNGFEAQVRFSKPGSAYRNVAVVDEAGRVIKKIDQGAGRVEGGQEIGASIQKNITGTPAPVGLGKPQLGLAAMPKPLGLMQLGGYGGQ